MKTRHALHFIIALVLVAGLQPYVAAQDFRGAIGGTVKDESGGVLPGATMTVTNTATNVANRVVTNDRGFYQVAT